MLLLLSIRLHYRQETKPVRNAIKAARAAHSGIECEKRGDVPGALALYAKNASIRCPADDVISLSCTFYNRLARNFICISHLKGHSLDAISILDKQVRKILRIHIQQQSNIEETKVLIENIRNNNLDESLKCCAETEFGQNLLQEINAAGEIEIAAFSNQRNYKIEIFKGFIEKGVQTGKLQGDFTKDATRFITKDWLRSSISKIIKPQ